MVCGNIVKELLQHFFALHEVFESQSFVLQVCTISGLAEREMKCRCLYVLQQTMNESLTIGTYASDANNNKNDKSNKEPRT